MPNQLFSSFLSCNDLHALLSFIFTYGMPNQYRAIQYKMTILCITVVTWCSEVLMLLVTI